MVSRSPRSVIFRCLIRKRRLLSAKIRMALIWALFISISSLVLAKRGGAWCGSYRPQAYKDGKRVAPVVTIVCNFSQPAPDEPLRC